MGRRDGEIPNTHDKARSSAATSALAERYASDPDFKREADEAMGVYHVPPHPEGECRGCDNAREKGLIESGS